MKVIKVDTDNKEYRISGVTFEILDSDMNVIETLTTDENGEAISSKLPCIDETYYLKEISSNEFYELPNEVKEVVLTENEITDIVFENNAKTSSLQVIKVDKDNKEKRIEGVTFEVLDENNKTLEKIITDKNGEALTSRYPLRDFQKLKLREVETLENYTLSNEIKTITLKENQVVH